MITYAIRPTNENKNKIKLSNRTNLIFTFTLFIINYYYYNTILDRYVI